MAEMEAVPGGEEQRARAQEHMEDAYLRDLEGDDFLGVQTYTRVRFNADGPTWPADGAPRTKMGYEYRPEAVEHAVRRAAAVTGLPIVVTEMGLSTDDDRERVAFIDAVVAGASSCLADGLDVRGLFYWTLLDNFEWSLGYTQPFGLVACDRRSFQRAPKPSAAHWGSIAVAARQAPSGTPSDR
jgi:beta-glucosidase